MKCTIHHLQNGDWTGVHRQLDGLSGNYGNTGRLFGLCALSSELQLFHGRRHKIRNHCPPDTLVGQEEFVILHPLLLDVECRDISFQLLSLGSSSSDKADFTLSSDL